MGLGLMMTWFLMQPVMLQVDQQALAPYRAGTISGEQALELGAAPVKTYMLRYAREKDLALFASAGMTARPKTAEDLPMQVVVPAYMLSELKAGFQIGAVLFLPFLLVDLAVASITTSVGHDAVAAGGDLDADQDPAVCDGGWMEPAGGLVAEELLRRERNLATDEARANGTGHGGGDGAEGC